MENKNLLKSQFAYYLINGTFTFFIYYLCILIFVSLFHIPKTYSITLAYFIAIIFNFFGNRNFVFSATNGRIKSQIYRFVMIALVNYFIQILAIEYFYSSKGYNFYMASFAGIFVAIAIGFVISKFWIFNKKFLNWILN